jgi:hypothetical protein
MKTLSDILLNKLNEAELSEAEANRDPEVWTSLVDKIWNSLDKVFEDDTYIYIGKLDGISIYLVDGDEIKPEHVEFVEGGNDKRYKWIQDKTILLDANLTFKDLKENLLHEFLERTLMDKHHMTYEQAHSIANTFERRKRKKEIKNK